MPQKLASAGHVVLRESGRNVLVEALEVQRDRERLADCRKRVNILPLGSGALAGTALALDREALAKDLHHGPEPFGLRQIELVDWTGEEDIDTLGGLVFSIAGRIPARGELVRHPSGVEFEVTGSHTQGTVKCTGFVKVTVKGGKLGPLTIASLVGTGLTGALFAFAGRPKVGG